MYALFSMGICRMELKYKKKYFYIVFLRILVFVLENMLNEVGMM